jgi:transcriptional regulator with XRE-family HTH domain
MDMNKTTGNRVKSLRLDKGLSQGEMGKLLGLDQGTVSKMERGENEPTAKTLRLLREIFDVTTDWILTGEGTKHPLPLDTEEEIKEIIDDLNTNELFKIRVLSFCYDYKAKHLSEFIKKKRNRSERLKRGKG